MSRWCKVLRLSVLALTIAAGSATLVVGTASAGEQRSSACAKKKKKKSKGKAKAGSKKVDSAQIVKWSKAGVADEEIVARASTGGFKMTKKAELALKKGGVSGETIRALGGKAEIARAPGGSGDPDFDSVPPPKAQKKKAADDEEEEEDEEEAAAPEPPADPPKRRVIVAKDE